MAVVVVAMLSEEVTFVVVVPYYSPRALTCFDYSPVPVETVAAAVAMPEQPPAAVASDVAVLTVA